MRGSWRPFLAAATRRVLLGIALGVVLLLASFGGATRSLPQSEGSNIPYRAAPLGVAPLAVHALSVKKRPTAKHPAACKAANGNVTYAVTVRDAAIVARARPGGGAILGTFPKIDQNGYPSVFGVVGTKTGGNCGTPFYKIQLPVSPNGTTGWVAAWAVRVLAIHTRIEVSLSGHHLAVFHGKHLAFQARVAVGTPDTPTPTGRFFVNERFVLANSNGPFGVAALGISAHSTVLSHWVQGGPIGIHGTNEPRLIGDAASHGCIRLFNQDMARLFKLAPAGTPVVIRP